MEVSRDLAWHGQGPGSFTPGHLPSIQNMIPEESPELSRLATLRDGSIVPAQVTLALATKGQAPSVFRKPAVLDGRMTVGEPTRTRREGMKLTAEPGRVGEAMDA